MARRKNKFGSAILKKFYQNDAGSYFDYLMSNLNDAVDDVTTTNQPEEFDALVVSEEQEKIRRKVKGTDKNYRSFKIRFLDENYGTETSGLPDPFQASNIEDYKKRLQWHPLAIVMEEGLDDEVKFGATVTVKKQEGTWVINKYVLDTSESYEDFVKRVGKKQENIKNSKFKPVEESKTIDGTNLDELPEDSWLAPQEWKINSLHPDFKPTVELIMKDLKSQGYDPVLNFGWRSHEEQKEMKAKGWSTVDFSFHNITFSNGKPASMAADIVDSTMYKNEKDRNLVGKGPKGGNAAFWTALGKASAKQGISGDKWGGNWTSFKDMPHIQLKNNRELRNIKKQQLAGKIEDPDTYQLDAEEQSLLPENYNSEEEFVSAGGTIEAWDDYQQMVYNEEFY